ncbi:unnamed protein product [Ambrosiozyma monospora]|uniref:Unnamed protein product n=1 Tax=Ambrosiozyma monospora TaxID=43982 RepID=A0ACB5U510_AMBMO|nr:unnamed protein product [Ambrosiozyma monospora]
MNNNNIPNNNNISNSNINNTNSSSINSITNQTQNLIDPSTGLPLPQQQQPLNAPPPPPSQNQPFQPQQQFFNGNNPQQQQQPPQQQQNQSINRVMTPDLTGGSNMTSNGVNPEWLMFGSNTVNKLMMLKNKNEADLIVQVLKLNPNQIEMLPSNEKLMAQSIRSQYL